jgi:hypothetical protein
MTGNSWVDAMTKVFLWLGSLVLPKPPEPKLKQSAEMTNSELREALFGLAWPLTDNIGRIHQASFDGRAVDDPRWHHALPTTVQMHVRGLITAASDSYGLACIGLQSWASAAALGPIRHLGETLVLVRWLLDGDEREQRARGYALTAAAIKSVDAMTRELGKLADSEQSQRIAAHKTTAIGRLRTDLAALRTEDGLEQQSVPQRKALFGKYLPDAGYLVFVLLSNAGSHPGAVQSTLFFADPGSASVVYDFVGPDLQIERAFWISQAIGLYIELCRLAGPVLGWENWGSIVDWAEARLHDLGPEVSGRWQERRGRSVYVGEMA